MEDYLKIGVLGAVVGTLDNGGHYMVQPINAAGKKVVAMNNDAPGLIPDAIALGNDGEFVYRVVRDDSERYSVPRYDMTPELASLVHRDLIWPLVDDYVKENLDKIWIQTINEPDQARAGWVGEFCVWQNIHFWEYGAKTANPGWAAGTPAESAWKEPEMVLYLQWCTSHPDRCAISLHEYSYTTESIWGGSGQAPYPYMVGRFQFLFRACDEMKLPRPKIYITEWGWEHREVPNELEALSQILQAGDLYAEFPQVKAAGLWYSGDYQGSGIDRRVNQWFKNWGKIASTYQKQKRYLTEGIELMIDPDGGTTEPGDEERWWQISIDEQINHGIQIADTAIQNAIRADGFHPVTKEMYLEGEPPMMAAEDWETRTRPRRLYIYEEGTVQYIEDPEEDPDPPPPPRKELDLTQYIRGDGRMYVVRHEHGPQENFQTQWEGPQDFYQVKNSQWEQMYIEDGYIWRSVDTSPGPAPDYAENPGEPRFYVQYEEGKSRAKWCPIYMEPGEFWESPNKHSVQFMYKEDCTSSAANSGSGLRNKVELVAHYDTFTTDQGGTVNDVVKLKAGGEFMYYAKNWGLIAWKHADSESGSKGSGFTGEILTNRPDLTRETGCFGG
jgi:hypothetical protein